MPRRHDIDALRALAFSLLMLYHLAMLYVHDWGWHLKSSYTTEAIQVPMLFVNRWRMDLIFLLSGVATAFLLQGRSPREFINRRAAKLLLPLAFGMAFVVPIQPYLESLASGKVKSFLTWNHLWYLAYLLFYTLVLAAILPMLRSRAGERVRDAFLSLRGWRLLVYPATPLLLYTLSLQPYFPSTHALVDDWYYHAVYFTMFLYGLWLASSTGVWTELARLRKVSLGAALATFAIYIAFVKMQGQNPPYAVALAIWISRNAYIWLALCAILGWGHALLNRPFKWLPFANEAVYPWYILHQSLIVVLAYAIVPLKIGAVLEPVVIFAGTISGCWALHVGVIARVRWLRPCFGMNAPVSSTATGRRRHPFGRWSASSRPPS